MDTCVYKTDDSNNSISHQKVTTCFNNCPHIQHKFYKIFFSNSQIRNKTDTKFINNTREYSFLLVFFTTSSKL
jgi:hypothetical protein